MKKEIRDVLEAPFAPEMIEQREGSFGKVLDYVEGWAVIQRLNEAFEGDWTFEIERFEILEDEVVVLGKFSANGIVKTQFGSSSITRAEDTGKPICLGDDLKGAATDAVKKCATLMGVALYLYNGDGTPLVTVSEKEGAIFCSAGTSLPGTSSIGPSPQRQESGEGNGNSRLTHKQLNYLISLAKDIDWTFKELNEESRKIYCIDVDQISRREASDFISIMKAKANS